MPVEFVNAQEPIVIDGHCLVWADDSNALLAAALAMLGLLQPPRAWLSHTSNRALVRTLKG
jgi:hypothetical protein